MLHREHLNDFVHDKWTIDTCWMMLRNVPKRLTYFLLGMMNIVNRDLNQSLDQATGTAGVTR